MPLYEHIFMLRPDMTEAQAEQICEQYKAVITDNGGKVTKTESWGLRTIAYKIDKHKKAFYTLLNIDAPAAAVHELERQQRLSEDNIRFFTVRVEALEDGPSAIVLRKEKEERKRREREELGEGYGFELNENA